MVRPNEWRPKVSGPEQIDNLAANAGRVERKMQEENERLKAELESLRSQNADLRGEPDEPLDPSLEARRRSRKPFGNMAQKLFYAQRKNFHRRWFNDEPGRIDQAKSAGYEHVVEDGAPVKRVVGKFPNGNGKFGYLMEIPQAWFDEDMMKNQEVVDKTCEDIYRGRVGRNVNDGGYVKKLPRGLDMSR